MADTERPKRPRGAKLLEEGYRAGFADGLRHAIAEIEARQTLDYSRETTILSGLAALRSQKTNAPKRMRRTKETKVDPLTGETYERGSGRGPVIIPSSSSA